MPTVNYQISAGGDDTVIDNYNINPGSGGTFNASGTTIILGMTGYNGTKRASSYLFRNVTIPCPATITDAYFRWKSAGVSGGFSTQSFIVYGNDAENPTPPTDVASFWAKVLTTANVNWQQYGYSSANVWYNSNSLATIVQELVNKYDYSSGRHMQFRVHCNCMVEKYYTHYAYESNPADSMMLYITYTPKPLATDVVASVNPRVHIGPVTIAPDPSYAILATAGPLRRGGKGGMAQKCYNNGIL